MHTAHRIALGRGGEDLAVRLLEDAGLLVLDRNWRDGRRGELDIVAWDEALGALVVVEVRTRTGSARGTALESVDPRKLLRLRRLAAAWLDSHDIRGRVRLDVVALTVRPRGAGRVGTPAGTPGGADPPPVRLLAEDVQVEWVQGVGT